MPDPVTEALVSDLAASDRPRSVATRSGRAAGSIVRPADRRRDRRSVHRRARHRPAGAVATRRGHPARGHRRPTQRHATSTGCSPCRSSPTSSLQLQANWMADYRNSSGIVLEDGSHGPTLTIEDCTGSTRGSSARPSGKRLRVPSGSPNSAAATAPPPPTEPSRAAIPTPLTDPPASSPDHPPQEDHHESTRTTPPRTPSSTPSGRSAHLDDPNVRFVEVDVDTTAYEQSHIPGAVGWDWTSQLSDGIRRDIASREELQRAAVGLGHRPGHDDRPVRRQQQLVRRVGVLAAQAVRPSTTCASSTAGASTGSDNGLPADRRRAQPTTPTGYQLPEPDFSLRAYPRRHPAAPR